MVPSRGMRVIGWLFIIPGVLIGVLAFVLTAHSPGVNVWPFLGAGFVCTTIGVLLVMTERRKPRDA